MSEEVPTVVFVDMPSPRSLLARHKFKLTTRFLGGLLVLFTGLDSTFAQRPSPPYKVVVTDNNALARSGGGKRFYPTSKFKQGEILTVLREDFGGWLMIDPPLGSFSLIRQEHVDRESPKQGVVKTDGAVVWIGSDFGGNFDAKQRHLLSGDDVQILGEQTINSDGRRIEMYKIKPPSMERRWIAQRWVVPVDQYQQLQARQSEKERIMPDKVSGRSEKTGIAFTDPFESIEIPAPKRPAARTEKPAPLKAISTNTFGLKDKTAKIQRSKPKDSNSSRNASVSYARMKIDRERLRRLDNQFRSIIKKPQTTWDFAKLNDAYCALKKTAYPSVANQVKQRLSAVDRYKQKRQAFLRAYNYYAQVTRRIQQRDQQILSNNVETRTTPFLQATTRRNLSGPAIPNPNTSPHRSTPIHTQAASTGSSAQRFDGAGIIQRSAMTFRGAPRHVLLAPNGRILAYLQATTRINLDQFIGQSMGVQGRRQYRPELQTDLMVVQDLAPVRLAGGSRVEGQGGRFGQHGSRVDSPESKAADIEFAISVKASGPQSSPRHPVTQRR